MTTAKKKKRPISYYLVNVGIGFLGLFAILPLIWTFYTSLRRNVDINKFPTKFSFENLSFDAYLGVWRDTNFPLLIKNSLIVSTMTVIISLTLGTLAGYALSRSKFKGRQSVLLVYLAIRLVPGVLLLIPIYIFMNNLGLLDSYVGLTLAYTTFTLPATVWLMKGFFDSLPPDLENAARIDGCSRMGAMWRVSIPLVLPGLAATGTLTAITAWNDVLFAIMLTSSDRTRTWPVGLREMIGEFQLPWEALTATAMLSLLPVVIGFALVGRKMVAGITAGSLKD
ncbi:MAG: carbohydrate ABC transporter permease [Candidatus Planktophila sp.]